MNKAIDLNGDECYRVAEKKAEDYFKLLYEQVEQNNYVPALITDIQSWKSSHFSRYSVFSMFSNRKQKPDSKNYYHYLQWLNYTGKLDSYLERSVSYIFMRDLGKPVDSPETYASIRRWTDSLKNHLTNTTLKSRGSQSEPLNLIDLYRTAQKENIETSMIWVLNKLKNVNSKIPKGMNADEAKRKLIKIIGGVILHVAEEMDDNVTPEERKQRLEMAIRLGYSYGLTYPFIDDLLDSNILVEEEKRYYSNLIRTTLLTGSVPELRELQGENKDLLEYIHAELSEAFHFIKNHQNEKTLSNFYEQSYIFFHAQETDRLKDLSKADYTNEELYIPIIIKSSSSRLIIRSILSAPFDDGFNNRTFFYGIYNQLADDFADMFDDLNEGAVTPYTYYLTHHDTRQDLINPFELYWAVISYLIHHVYNSNLKVREVILDRAINGLKRFKERWGTEKYNEVMKLFSTKNAKFNTLIRKMVEKATDVDFFDKLLRDQMQINFKKGRQEREDFLVTIETVREQINSELETSEVNEDALIKDSINEAVAYVLGGNGKRLRPVMAWVMGVQEYHLKSSTIMPLLRALEYMHTASLIFDDLPSQDNASVRRGRPTLHQVYDVATAELTALFMTQKAMEELTTLEEFDSKTVLHLIRYASQITMDMCRGQAMDLESKEKILTHEQLNSLSLFKTGLGFEAALLMPAMLASVGEQEIESLKKFAHHTGIAFQIQDDLLDVEGNQAILGKPIGKDAENNNSTFVSILGPDGARKAMWEHYCLAMEALREIPRDIIFLKTLLNYIVNRDH